MKKIFYSLMTVAALLTAASCQKEFTNSPDPAYGGKPVVTTFSVDLGVTTKASASTGLDDGTTVNKLYVAAFGSDGKLVSTSLVGNNAKSATGPSTQVSLTLSKGQAYDIVFFWVYDGAYNVSFADNNTATFSYKTSSLKANDPQLDAFYTKVSVASASTTTESVTLKRPFAQINVLSSNVPEGQTAFKSTMTVKAAPTTFDLFNGAVGSETADLEFAENAISEAAFGKYAQNYTWIGMNFVLPAASGAVAVNFKESGMAAAIDVNNVAVKKNTRTNLVGAIYDLDATITYNVTVDPIFENEGEAGLDDEDTEITVADGSSYTANNPLVIDASNGANPVSVTLNVNGGDNFSDIESGAAGGVIEASSDDEEVATAEVNKTGNAVTITPVGNGTANITVTTPRYTKAFSAGSITIPVQVTGIAAPAVDPELSVSGFPTAATSAPFTVSLTNNSDGELTITVNPDGAATVEAGTTAGVYTVTPAEFESNTEVTVTFATAATAAFNAGEVVGTFTIAGSGGGDEPPTDDYYVKVTSAPADWSGDYLIVFEGEDASLAFDGGLETLDSPKNTIAVTIEDGKIAVTTETVAAEFKIAKMTGGYSIKAANGQYIGNTKQANNAPANGLTPKDEELLNTIGFSDGNLLIVSNTTELKYNNAAGDNNQRFRYYKSGNNQQPISLYKKGGSSSGGDTPGDQTVTATLSVTPASLNLLTGATETLQVTTNSTATPTFETSDASVATVDANGKVTAIAAGSATITVAVAAVEGAFTSASKTVAVTVTAPAENPYKKVTSITSGKTYVLVGKKGDKYYAATPLASDKTYGRLNGYEVSVADDKINVDMSAYEFTFTAVTGGYSIAMPDGRLLACDTEHNGTFQIGDDFDHTFTVEFLNDGTAKIVHKETSKTVYHGGGTYTNFSCSSSVPDDGTMLILFSK